MEACVKAGIAIRLFPMNCMRGLVMVWISMVTVDLGEKPVREEKPKFSFGHSHLRCLWDIQADVVSGHLYQLGVKR